MINESIQRSCQWEAVSQMFALDAIFLKLGSPRWRCHWNFGEVPAWRGLCSCFLNIQFCSSMAGSQEEQDPRHRGVGLPACPEVCLGFQSQHMATSGQKLQSEHWGGTFSFSKAENSFRSAGHKVKYQLHGAHLLPESKLWRWLLVKLMRKEAHSVGVGWAVLWVRE